jgi:hypothetical protein
MKHLKIPFLLLGSLVAACGGGGSDTPPDGPPDVEIDGGVACNPVAQTGCADSEKCTWQDVTADLGRIACVPNGTVAIGGTCTFLDPGETAGYDDCVRGAYCLSGTCQEICTDAPDSCDSATSACSSYSGLFEGADVSTGVCDFKCEPGTQERLFDDAAGCGGSTERPRGCYGWAWSDSPIEYTCTPDISDARHGAPPNPLNPQNIPYLNSCDAGYFPWQLNNEPDAPDACVAFCTPGETHSGATANVDGVAPFTCGAKGAVDAINNMECRFLHIFDSTPPLDQYNASGVCFATSAYVGDWDGMAGTPETGLPRCTQLTNTIMLDTDGDMTPDTPEHEYWGCAPWTDPPAFAPPGGKMGGFRAVLEEKLRARLERVGKPVNVH